MSTNGTHDSTPFSGSKNSARHHANRSNAQHSTGPRTPEGKAKSSLNAIKTGLTGRTVLLPDDDAAAYQRHVQQFLDEYLPLTEHEQAIVQSLADTEWRLLRIPGLEFGIYALGQIEFANHFDHQEPAVRAPLIEAHTFLTYQKQLNNLSIQEARLRKQRDRERAQLQQLHDEREKHEEQRRARERTRLQEASSLYQHGKIANKPFNPADFGFEFSIQQIERFVAEQEKRRELDNRIYRFKKEVS